MSYTDQPFGMTEHIAGPEQVAALGDPLILLALHQWKGLIATAWGEKGENLWLFVVYAEDRQWQASDPSLSVAVRRAIALATNELGRDTTLNFDVLP
jgi:hypothetical protein